MYEVGLAWDAIPSLLVCENQARNWLSYSKLQTPRQLHTLIKKGGARWLSGRVSDSGARGPGFETYRRRVVSLSKTLYSPKVLVNYPGSDGSVPRHDWKIVDWDVKPQHNQPTLIKSKSVLNSNLQTPSQLHILIAGSDFVVVHKKQVTGHRFALCAFSVQFKFHRDRTKSRFIYHIDSQPTWLKYLPVIFEIKCDVGSITN